MIKRIGIFLRRQDLNQMQFLTHWTKRHSPIVSKMTNVKQYIQNHRSDLLPNYFFNSQKLEVDGIAEMYWDEEEKMKLDFLSNSLIDKLKQDECEFMSCISVALVNEENLVGGKSDIKLMLLCNTKKDMLIQNVEWDKTLPNLKGYQINRINEIMARPQLPSLPCIPNFMITFWYSQIEDIFSDFNSDLWQDFCKLNFGDDDQVSLSIFNPVPIRTFE